MSKKHKYNEEKESDTDTFIVSKSTVWQGVSAVLLVLLVVSVITGGFGNYSATGSITGGADSGMAAKLADGGSADAIAAKADSAPTALVNGEHVKGDSDAPITMYEWSDFECPYCGRFYRDTYGQIVENYVDTGKVKIVFKHFPLSFHAQAEPAALASECAGEQGMFWEMHDELFEKGVSGGVSTFKQYAVDLGLDADKFNSCLDSKKYLDKVKADMAEGQQKGISGTPGFIVNGQPISGAQPYAVFQAAIEGNGGTSDSGAAVAAPVAVKLDDAHIKGEDSATVTIVEWSDFECPYCGRFYRDTYGQIVENYVDTGKVKIVFKHFPLSFHAQAKSAALASECAGEQGMFWEMHDELFEKGVSGGETSFKTIAQQIGLNTQQFDDCYDSGKYNAKIDADMAEGQAAGIKGTPGFLINGKIVSGAQPYAVFDAAIKEALN